MALLLSLLVGVSFRRSLDNGFHFDDRPNIVQNPAVRVDRPSLGSLQRAAFASPLKRRPLAYLSFALDWWRGGGDPRTFQWTNLVLHGANALLVYGLLVICLGRGAGGTEAQIRGAALAAAGLWAAHPIQVQAVTYIVQRMAQMATFFTLAAVLLYLVGRATPRRGRAAALFTLAGLAALAGGLSKETAWIAPLLILLAELGVVRRDRPLFRSRLGVVALAAVAVAGLALFAATLAGIGPLARAFEADYARREFSMLERVLTQPRAILFHFSQVLWPLPSRFSLEHDFAISRSLLRPPSTLPAICILLGASAGGLYLLGRRGLRHLGSFVLWVPATLLVEGTVAPLEMVFEHRFYLPTVGLAGLLAAGIAHLARRGRRTAWAVGVSAVALTLAVATSTAVYLRVWRSPRTLAENAVRHAPGSPRAWAGLAQAHLQEGRLEDAQVALERTLALDPDHQLGHEWLGVLYLDRGELERAEAELTRALAAGPPSSSLLNHLGEVRLARGAPSEAELLFRQAAALRPWVAVYRWNRAVALEHLERCEEALAAWREYLRLEQAPEDRDRVLRHLRESYPAGVESCPGPAPAAAPDGR